MKVIKYGRHFRIAEIDGPFSHAVFETKRSKGKTRLVKIFAGTLEQCWKIFNKKEPEKELAWRRKRDWLLRNKGKKGLGISERNNMDEIPSSFFLPKNSDPLE